MVMLLAVATMVGSGCSLGAAWLRPDLAFEVAIADELVDGPLDGRLFLMVSNLEDGEPRFQAGNWGSGSQPLFARDVAGFSSAAPVVIDRGAAGYPVDDVEDLPPGEYRVQAMLHVYSTFERSDGHTIKAPMDRWEGQNWRISPGNLYSDVQTVRIDPNAGGDFFLELSSVIPPVADPEDTEYVKHVKIRSELLSEFWGTDMYLGAIVLLPEGFDDDPDVHYPVAYYQGHFHDTFYTPVGFSEEPAPAGLSGYDLTYAEASHQFYQDWVSGRLPRMIIVTMQHPNPYFDDSYAVNSANLGPYGDALTEELIPFIEERFRAIGEGWARGLYGGSTGGWESLAWQVFYPDMFNGAWVNCPDPIDFRYYQLVNIYEDANAFYPDSDWLHEPIRPFRHDVDGQVDMSLKQATRLEEVLGTRSRSGQQLAIWNAVYGPVADDGFPAPLWDPETGVIDRDVALYMRDNYDLSHIIRRDWQTLGPKLEGKLHIAVGDEDNYYLEEAVMLLEEFLEQTEDPYYGGSVTYGYRHPHCYSGPPDDLSVRLTRLTYNQRILPQMAERMVSSAPPGADMSWRR
jgi:enterochelin esterase-like enzyme